jgi:membrane protease YdiL (CAAX protease family)
MTDQAPPSPRGAFSLEGRPVPALYLLGWLLSAVGFGLIFVAIQTPPPGGSLVLLVALIALGLGFSAAAGYQIVLRSSRSATAFRGASPALLLGIQIVLSVVFSTPLALLGLTVTTPVGFVLASAALFLGYIVVVWLFGFRTSALSWGDLGYRERPSASRLLGDIGTGLLATLLLWPITTTLLVILSLLLDTSTAEIVPAPTSLLDVLLLILGAAILVPVGEELLFRGYSVTAWLKDLGPRTALIRSTVFFAFAHVVNIQAETFEAGLRQAVLTMVVIAPVGLVLGWLFVRRGIVASIAGHITFNLIAVVLLTLAQSLT